MNAASLTTRVFLCAGACLLSCTAVMCMTHTAFADEVESAAALQQSDAASADESAELAAIEQDDALAQLASEQSVSTLASVGSFDTETYAGPTMFETAVEEALAAYPEGSKTAIIVGPGDAWIDALSASGLCATRGPILFCNYQSVPECTMAALRQLGVESVVIIGGTAAVGEGAEAQLAQEFSIEARLGGENCIGTQMAIYNYGVNNGLWSGDKVIVATGTWYGDALSVSPVAYAQAVPIFLESYEGTLNSEQMQALQQAASSGRFSNAVIVGGVEAVHQGTEDFLKGLFCTNRLWGANQYSTSVEISEWAVNSQGFSWDNVAYTTGLAPYDALAGSVLQGKSKSVMLLVGSTTDKTVWMTGKHGDSINTVRFFGGEAAVTPSVRSAILNGGSEVTYVSTGISLSNMASLEYAVLSDGSQASYDEKYNALNPDNYSSYSSSYLQFAILNDGYSGQLSADQLNSFISSTTKGRSGVLAGQGQAFIDAANTSGVNEVYLLTHAILESGWGTSTLAQGCYYDGAHFFYRDGSQVYNSDGSVMELYGYAAGNYYNLFGYGAYDSNPMHGFVTAVESGWNSVYNAVVYCGSKISANYLNNEYGQNTLYKMRWNYVALRQYGYRVHEYATSITWANSIANIMSNCYSYLGVTPYLRYQIPDYD